MKILNPVTVILIAVVILGTSGILLATRTNDRVESSAKKSHVFETYLKGDDINIKTMNDSVVILTGTVSEWSHRSLAEETVAGLPGVKKVDNKLEVKGGEPAENSDILVGMKVKSMLMFHRNVSGLETDVEVEDGVVALRGQATSESQKELTTEYVKGVEGVKNVNNDMTVEKSEKTNIEKVSENIDDASITAQVKFSLLFHSSTSAINTNIETKNGVVTVSGVAKNSAEKDLVDKLINNIKGVKSVKNKMEIG